MALKQRERLLLATTITLTVVGVNYFLLVPLIRNWNDVRSQLTFNRRELAGMEAMIRFVPGWQKQYKELAERLQQAQQPQQTSDMQRKIQEIGTSSGIQMKSLQPMQAVEKDVYREQPFLCNFESTTDTLVKFLYGLQTGSGFMSVEDLQVTPQTENISILRCTVRIRALAGKTGGAKS
jgi:Tfp pilus assembly protein PilO